MTEIVFKILISIILIIWFLLTWVPKLNIFKKKIFSPLKKIGAFILTVYALSWVWTNQIDGPATFKKKIDEALKMITEEIIAREDDMIYQNNNVVGKIFGTPIIEENEDLILFPKIYDSNELILGSLIEYQRFRCKIITLGKKAGIEAIMKENSVTRLNDVVNQVVCEIIN